MFTLHMCAPLPDAQGSPRVLSRRLALHWGGGVGGGWLVYFFIPRSEHTLKQTNKASSSFFWSQMRLVSVSPFTGLPSESEQLVRLERVRGGGGSPPIIVPSSSLTPPPRSDGECGPIGRRCVCVGGVPVWSGTTDLSLTDPPLLPPSKQTSS